MDTSFSRRAFLRASVVAALGAGVSTGAPLGEAGRGGPRADALSALTNLGYPHETAARAVAAALAALGRDSQLEPLLRAALGNLMG